MWDERGDDCVRGGAVDAYLGDAEHGAVDGTVKDAWRHGGGWSSA